MVYQNRQQLFGNGNGDGIQPGTAAASENDAFALHGLPLCSSENEISGAKSGLVKKTIVDEMIKLDIGQNFHF
ncbi:hypothetical protein DSCA_10040 [Desulfosarcina alkanivorans]|uniref:Uncharacterized protein n=1 Tax=Desulfosarcina alkanivorans TaxID=571177 RepID=A0A5K7YLA1_9BACT|nr:hypothetical protein DSCA_10040 [Desulfosarcina alkanivorans]